MVFLRTFKTGVDQLLIERAHCKHEYLYAWTLACWTTWYLSTWNIVYFYTFILVYLHTFIFAFLHTGILAFLQILHTILRVSHKTCPTWFLLNFSGYKTAKKLDIIHWKGGIHSFVWSTKTFLYDIREPRYKQIKMGYQISKCLNIGQS